MSLVDRVVLFCFFRSSTTVPEDVVVVVVAPEASSSRSVIFTVLTVFDVDVGVTTDESVD